jgi:post-segregation antitoxin (ccd killing protein)
MKSVPDLIEALGGHQQLARALRVPPGTVSSWKSRRAIPARVWTALVAHARKRQLQGIDLETLASLHSPSKRRAAKVEAQGRAANGRRRTRVKIRIDKDLLDEAANLGIDVNALADDVLATVPRRVLKSYVTSLERERHRIIRSIDSLFSEA